VPEGANHEGMGTRGGCGRTSGAVHHWLRGTRGGAMEGSRSCQPWRNEDKRGGEGGFQELPTMGGGGQEEGRGRAPGAATMLVRYKRGTGARGGQVLPAMGSE
jgi:hypothetical protein